MDCAVVVVSQVLEGQADHPQALALLGWILLSADSSTRHARKALPIFEKALEKAGRTGIPRRTSRCDDGKDGDENRDEVDRLFLPSNFSQSLTASDVLVFDSVVAIR